MLLASAPARVSYLCRHLPPRSPASPRPVMWELGLRARRRNLRLPTHGAAPLQQQFEPRPNDDGDGRQQGWEENAVILCDSCNGRGWLLCDFCKGQKINVKSETNRIYRRCPSCKAAGCVLCPTCKVFKCITFPDYGDDQT